MKLSINWLSHYFASNPAWDDIFHKLTVAGIEVEGIEDIANDRIVEFKITPNRGDCLSVLGILREISALTDYTIAPPQQNIEFNSTQSDKIQVDLVAPDACPNYYTLLIKNINNQAVLPSEIVQRLDASGIKSISPVVDITNYVMLELGQPLHAFDSNKVGSKISIRFAKTGESLQLLDDTEARLLATTLVICNSHDEAIAIAGVMGGLDSAVGVTTTDVVLESAFFVPEIIAGGAKTYGVSSDAAYRFERGVDPVLQERAIKYAAGLITRYCGGEIGQLVAKTNEVALKQININYATIRQICAIDIADEVINSILNKLGFICRTTDAGTEITVPSYRFDVTIVADIIEEVARVYGYDNIEAKMPVALYNLGQAKPNAELGLKTKLVDLGYNEVISYSFLEDKLERLLGNPDYTPVRLQNPIANLQVMRTSLIANLVKALQYNLNHGHKRVRIFELARVFYGESIDVQPLKLAALAYGNYAKSNWAVTSRAVDFYDLRNDVELLLGATDEIKFVADGDNPVFHSTRCAKILLRGEMVGTLGQLHPKYKTEFDLTELPYIFELNVASIVGHCPKILVKETLKFQKTRRDLALLIEAQVNVGDVLDAILHAAIPYLVTANVFDVYQGDKLAGLSLQGNAVKSIAINFLFQGNKTLSEEEINTSISLIQQCIQTNFTVQFRI